MRYWHRSVSNIANSHAGTPIFVASYVVEVVAGTRRAWRRNGLLTLYNDPSLCGNENEYGYSNEITPDDSEEYPFPKNLHTHVRIHCEFRTL
jgi:hypothetical protein